MRSLDGIELLRPKVATDQLEQIEREQQLANSPGAAELDPRKPGREDLARAEAKLAAALEGDPK